MSKFKVGDKVVALEDQGQGIQGSVIKGRTYTVEQANQPKSNDEIYLYELRGWGYWDESKFMCPKIKATKIARKVYAGRIEKEEEGWLWLK